MNVVIYARYSSSKQREESIETQLKMCHEYAERNNDIVIHEYVDRAISGRTDDRPQLQQMLKDSRKKQFEKILVYRLDRFSRKTADIALYKATLQKIGIKIESATELIPDNSCGVLLEGITWAINEWYSVELGEKMHNRLALNAEKCQFNGGAIPLGYRVENKHFVIDEATAPIVKEIYTKYAEDWTVKQICDNLNQRGIKSSKNAVFNKNSLHKILTNRRYLGIYIYADIEKPGGIPQIIDEELFDRVQAKVTRNKEAPARARAKAEYILSGKLYCGYCKEKMVGHSSNQISKKGVIFNYYKCKNSGGKKPCKKKMVHKDYIEDTVIRECKKLLTPQNIRRIAKEVHKIALSLDDRAELHRLEELLNNANTVKNNHIASLRACNDDMVRQMIFDDLAKIGTDIQEFTRQLEIEKKRHYVMSEDQIIEHLTNLANGDIHDKTYRKFLIQIFVNRIYLYDDKFTITFNTGDEEVTISDILLGNIEDALMGKTLCLSNIVRHQKSRYPKGYLLFCCQTGIRRIKCNSPVDCCLPPVSTAATP